MKSKYMYTARARETYTCDACGGLILPGQEYQRTQQPRRDAHRMHIGSSQSLCVKEKARRVACAPLAYAAQRASLDLRVSIGDMLSAQKRTRG